MTVRYWFWKFITACFSSTFKAVWRVLSNTAFSSILNLLALIGVVTTIIYAHNQFSESKRAVSLNSLSALYETYTRSRIRLFSWISETYLSNDSGYITDNVSTHEEILTRLYLHDYLQVVELTCDFYIDAVFEEEVRMIFESNIKEDMKFLLLFYVEEGVNGGHLVINGEPSSAVSVPWIAPRDATDEDRRTDEYPITKKCFEEMKIEIARLTLDFS